MKITEEQLEKIKKQQDNLSTLINNIGFLETQKHNYLHQLGELNKVIDSTKVELEKEYGSVNINMENGEYSLIEEESKLKVVENV
jgi:hypothetical protein